MITEIHADRLGAMLNDVGTDFDVLSLDCFDTLIWRTTPEPPDIFCALRPPLSRVSRMVAEQTARERRLVAAGTSEVTLDDIYRVGMPGADDAEIAARVAEEIALEHRHCVAFAPTVELIRDAKRRGKRVVVVSDTYLTTEQLTDLIAAKAGSDVVRLIDAVFCSSRFGCGKTHGLFARVLRQLGVPASRVLHVGDNPRADVAAAAEAGIRSVHLLQGDASLLEQWRLELAGMLIADDSLRHRTAPLLPHRPLLAERARAIAAPGARLGYATLGPIMFGYARWIRDEALALQARDGGRVKVCFLLRDGHLPKLVYDAIVEPGDPPSFAIEISRYTAIATTLEDETGIVSYLGMMATASQLEPLAKQLLLMPQEAAPLIARARRDAKPIHRFADAVLQPKTLSKITQRSAAARKRLFAYLRRHVDPQPGETLMFVDVGGAGTVQNRVQKVITAEFGVHVEGRFLLLRDVPRAHDAKRGFFGPDEIDGRVLDALYTYIAIVEQMCTLDQGSVVDYTEGGDAVRRDADIGPHQVARRLEVQTACLDFVRDAGAFLPRKIAADKDALRHGALAAFARVLLLPLQQEVEFFESFAHDMNLGVRDTLPFLDTKAAGEDLRRVGPLYVNSSLRVHGPAELRRHGLDLALLLLARRRFDLDLRPTDFSREAFELPVMIVRGRESSIVRVQALATHEGFYAASIPIGRCEYAVGVLFGQLFEWVQLESARVAPVKLQFEVTYRDDEQDLTASAVHENIRAEANGLLHCTAKHAFTYFAPAASGADENCVLRVVFRPLAWRAAQPGGAVEAVAHGPAARVG